MPADIVIYLAAGFRMFDVNIAKLRLRTKHAT